MRRSSVIALSTLLLVFSAGLMRLNDLSLYTDSTRYLLWAQSLSTGNGWMDSSQPVPETYVVNAPLYPLFIAPSQWLQGSPMDAAKAMTLAYGLAALALFFVWSRRSLGDMSGTTVGILVAAMPMTVVLFTEVLSEALFLLVVFAVLLLLEDREKLTGRRRTLLIVLLAVLPLVREVGIALIAAVAAVEFVRGERRFAVTITSAALGIFLLWSLRNLLLVGTPETSQAANVSFIFQRALSTTGEPLIIEFIRRIGSNLSSYRYELGGMIVYPVPFPLIHAPTSLFRSVFEVLQAVKSFVPVVFVPMLLLGMWKDWMSGPQGRIRVLFVLFSFSIVILYPVQDVRFLYPFIPFFLFFCARSLRLLRYASAIVATVAAAVILIPNLLTTVEVVSTNQRYHQWLSDTSGTTLPPGAYFATPWERAGKWIVEHTPPDIIIATSAKEIVPFVGGRKVLEINKAVPRPQFSEMLRDHDVEFIVSPVIQTGIHAYGFHIPESGRLFAERKTTVGSLALLGLRSPLRDQGASGGTMHDPLLVSQPELQAARKAILALAYARADSILTGLLSNDPGNAEASFQRLVALSLSGDRSAARDAQQLLFRAPRSTSYIPVSRRLLEICGHLENARRLDDPSLKSGAFYLAGRGAWELGYDHAARYYLDEALSAQGDAFEPLIWSAYYAIEDDDQSRAAEFLDRLRTLDPNDQIVQHLSRIHDLHLLLPQATDPAVASGYFLDMSASYERLELSSAAIDAAIRAVGSDARNDLAKEQLRRLLDTTGRRFAATRLANPS